jgi:hypothetical protein
VLAEAVAGRLPVLLSCELQRRVPPEGTRKRKEYDLEVELHAVRMTAPL